MYLFIGVYLVISELQVWILFFLKPYGLGVGRQESNSPPHSPSPMKRRGGGRRESRAAFNAAS